MGWNVEVEREFLLEKRGCGAAVLQMDGDVEELREDYPDKVFILPTSDAMWLVAKSYLAGELPGVEGFNKFLGGKDKSLWRDRLGHLGPGFDRLEGYVFYATLYERSPELIEEEITFGRSRFDSGEGYPGKELDRKFRKIAWQAVIGHPLSGVVDADGDGVADEAEMEAEEASEEG